MLRTLTQRERAAIEPRVTGKVWCFVLHHSRGPGVDWQIGIAVADEIGPRLVPGPHGAEKDGVLAHIAELNAAMGVYQQLATAIEESMHAANAKFSPFYVRPAFTLQEKSR